MISPRSNEMEMKKGLTELIASLYGDSGIRKGVEKMSTIPMSDQEEDEDKESGGEHVQQQQQQQHGRNVSSGIDGIETTTTARDDRERRLSLASVSSGNEPPPVPERDPFEKTAFVTQKKGFDDNDLVDLYGADDEPRASRRYKDERLETLLSAASGVENMTCRVTAPCEFSDMTFPAPHMLVGGSYGMREKLVKRWGRAVSQDDDDDNEEEEEAPCFPLSTTQRVLLPALASFRDVVFLNHTEDDRRDARHLYALHCLNHIMRQRAIVRKHDTHLGALKKAMKRQHRRERRRSRSLSTGSAGSPSAQQRDVVNDDDDVKDNVVTTADVDVRDQGFVRPRVLVLLPFRSDAEAFVTTLLSLLPSRYKVHNRRRFYDEYGYDDDDESDEDRNNKQEAEWRRVFKGNNDDCFRLGIQLSTSAMRLFTDFYHSDIVVASPLGLRLATGTEEDHKMDFDFLSSIEIAIIDRAGILQMQNWENVELAMQHVNRLPKEHLENDLTRIYEWALNEQGRYYRQTLMFSSFPTAEMRATTRTHCRSSAGILWIKRDPVRGVLEDVKYSVRQVFQRLPDASTPESAVESRMKYFREHHESLLRENSTHVLLYVESYFDFVVVRAFLKKQLRPDELCCLSSDETASDIARARNDFFHGTKRVMLLSGRFHFFRRYQIRGARHIVFYSLPNTPTFYTDILNASLTSRSRHRRDDSTGQGHSVVALFDDYDAIRVEGIVGSARRKRMIRGRRRNRDSSASSRKAAFLFC